MQFYSYLWLREDWTPYYAGKGHGSRAFKSAGHKVHRPKDRTRILVFLKASETEAFESERVLIAAFGRKDLGTGCLRNMTDGGDGLSGLILTEEQRLKWRLATSTRSKDWRRNIGKAMAGKPWSAARRAAQGCGKGWPSGQRRVLSEEHRRKLSQAMMGNTNYKGNVNGEHHVQ